MRLVIAGSRKITEYSVVQYVMQQTQFAKPLVVLSGCARGVDSLAIRWANEERVKVEYWPADWASHGKHAGYMRNVDMVNAADALLAVWDGDSRGTAHTIGYARATSKPYEVWLCTVNCKPVRIDLYKGRVGSE